MDPSDMQTRGVRKQGRSISKRPTVAVVIVSIFILMQALLYLFLGIFLLLSYDFVGSTSILKEPSGIMAVLGPHLGLGVSLTLFGLVAVAVFIGFLLRHRWAWIAAITWVAISLVIGLSAYFRGEPSYVSMVLNVVIVIALNQTAIQKEFHEESRADL